MDNKDPGERYRKGMSYHEKINLSYNLEQEIVENKRKLAELKNKATESTELSQLEENITKSERLLQTIQDNVHGIPAGRLQ